MIETDYLVIGSGLAGLYFALRASEHGRVVVATKRAPADANTAYAQGGVAGVLDPDDTVATHVEDTLRVGDGLCHRDIVEVCAREAPEHILWFANELGVPFDRDADGHLALGREGGHTARRIVHAKDTHRLGDPGGAARARRGARRPHHDAARPHGDRSADHGQVRRTERRVRRLPAGPDHRRGGDRRRARGRAGDRRLRARSTSTRRTRTSRPATASRWPTGWARASPTWSSSSSTPPASTTRRRSRS